VSLQDYKVKALRDQGYTGSANDSEYQFWKELSTSVLGDAPKKRYDLTTSDSIATILAPGYFDTLVPGGEGFVTVDSADGPYEVQLVGGVASVISTGGLSFTSFSNAVARGSVNAVDAGSSVMFVGDSITEGETSTAAFSRIYGVQLAVGAKLRFLDGYNQGVGGDTTSDILARIATVGANIADVVSLQAGTNDVSANETVEQYISNIEEIVRNLFYYGASVVVIHGVPEKSDSATFPWTDDQKALRESYNAALRTLDMDGVIIDVESGESFTADDDTTTDGTHLSLWGAVVLGSAQGAAILKAVKNANDQQGLLSDNLFVNPQLTGTSGTDGGVTSGDVADSWTVGSNVSGATVTLSKVSNAFGDGTESQAVTISGNVGSQTQVTNMRQDISITGVSGDIYVAFCRFKVVAGHSGLSNVTVKIGNDIFETVNEDHYTNEIPAGQEITGILTSMVVAPLSGGETTIQPQFVLRTHTGETGATVYFDSPICRKVN